MTSHISAAMLRAVRERARHICEYCRLDQESQEATFHIDHIEPRVNGGLTVLDNLALACVSCSLRKGYRNKYRDPWTGRRVRLFHPRRDNWDDHFIFTPRWQIRGRTPIGRATTAALDMNRIGIVAIRTELAAVGRFPPPQAQV